MRKMVASPGVSYQLLDGECGLAAESSVCEGGSRLTTWRGFLPLAVAVPKHLDCSICARTILVSHPIVPLVTSPSKLSKMTLKQETDSYISLQVISDEQEIELLTCIVPFKEHNDLAAAVPSLTSVATVVERMVERT